MNIENGGVNLLKDFFLKISKTMINRLILIYTIVLTITNIAGWTEIPWLWVGLPFWLFIFGPSLYTYIAFKLLKK